MAVRRGVEPGQKELRRFLVGPTASGKAKVAVAIAGRAPVELLSLDSMKLYREMEIGTAKPGPGVREQVRFHLLDLVDPDETMSVATYCARAEAAEVQVRSRGRIPLFAGGTPLYLKALTEGLFEGPPADPALRASLRAFAEEHGREALHERLRACDPASADRLHPNDLRRVVRAIEVFEATGHPISELQRQWDRQPRCDRRVVGLLWDREALYRRIDARVDRMMEAGFLQEVRRLRARPGGMGATARQALGYRELLAWLDAGEAKPLEEVVEAIKRNTRRFAKQQLTFFRQLPDIDWVPLAEGARPEELATDVARRLEL